MSNEKRLNLRWKNYLKKFCDSFTDTTKVDKCYGSNLIYKKRLYSFHIP